MSNTTLSPSATKAEPDRKDAFVKTEFAGHHAFTQNIDADEAIDAYKPRPQLPKPHVNLRSLSDLMRGLEDGSIDVDPEYQREVVWTADRMTGLINSLMENFYIPPIILNGKQKHTGSGRGYKTIATYVCVDGKQRLSSVRAFMKGLIPCHDYKGEKWWFCETDSRRRKVLSKEAQIDFLNKDFVAYQFEDLSKEQEEDLFARVQMGMQLSAAEKMRASSGPWQELARLFVDDFPHAYSLMKDRARAKDFQLTLSCFSQIVEVMHPAAANGIPVLKTNHGSLPKFLSNEGLVDDGIKSHLAMVWNTLQKLIELDANTFTNANKYLEGVQTFAPVEMVGVTVLISMYSESRSRSLLLNDIRALRTKLREHFADLRLKRPTWKFIWEFCTDLEAIRGAVDGSTVNRQIGSQASSAMPIADPSSMPSAPSTGARTTAKSKSSTNGKTRENRVKKAQPQERTFVERIVKATGTLSPVESCKRQRVDPMPPASHETSLPTPLQIRQDRVSRFQEYHHSSKPAATVSAGTGPAHSMDNSRARAVFGTGALGPGSIDEQWEGVVQSISPQFPPPAVPGWSRAISQQRKSTPRLKSTPVEAIDLTSDNEGEVGAS